MPKNGFRIHINEQRMQSSVYLRSPLEGPLITKRRRWTEKMAVFTSGQECHLVFYIWSFSSVRSRCAAELPSSNPSFRKVNEETRRGKATNHRASLRGGRECGNAQTRERNQMLHPVATAAAAAAGWSRSGKEQKGCDLEQIKMKTGKSTFHTPPHPPHIWNRAKANTHAAASECVGAQRRRRRWTDGSLPETNWWMGL